MSESTLDPYQDAAICGTGARHGFFTRAGGVSQGIYGGLNCGSGSHDEPERVAQNRARVAAHLGVEPRNLMTVFQVHSADAVRVNAPWGEDGPPRADAIATATPGIAVGVLTGDCGPLLFADETGGIVAAAHAGWKGAFTGIVEAAVRAMEDLGARRSGIVAALGPTISRRAYEVGPEFVARFVAADAANRDFFTPATAANACVPVSAREDHAMFDLPAFIARQMESAGIAGFADLGLCTYRDEEAFFSYRRATHRKEADYGRLIAAITPA